VGKLVLVLGFFDVKFSLNNVIARMISVAKHKNTIVDNIELFLVSFIN